MNETPTAARNINNNPTGKPYCCVIGCPNDATLDLSTPGEQPIQSCGNGDHVKHLLGDGGYVSAIEAPA